MLTGRAARGTTWQVIDEWIDRWAGDSAVAASPEAAPSRRTTTKAAPRRPQPRRPPLARPRPEGRSQEGGPSQGRSHEGRAPQASHEGRRRRPRHEGRPSQGRSHEGGAGGPGGGDRGQPDAPLRLGQLTRPGPLTGSSLRACLPRTRSRGESASATASGSVATGAFGTVPGPDAAALPHRQPRASPPLWAGLIVFLPKAWDVVLNPIAGRISDRTVDPRGPRRPWLLRAGCCWRRPSR